MKVVIMESLGIPEAELKACQKPFEEKGVVFESFARTTDEAKLIEEAKNADAMILAQSRTIHKEVPAYIEQVTQEELLANSDIVVLHCPLNESTRGMINAEKLSVMKPTAMLINVARGPVVVEKDLAEALSKGVIACAGIDVFDKEPPLDIESPLLKAPHTLVTPHVAFATKESMSLRAKFVFENLENWMEGRQSNIVL